jgi:uroporphyrinogen decarboxylase
MTGRERFEAIIAGELPDIIRPGGLAPWAETRERWIHEGMPPEGDLNEYLGLNHDDGMSLPLDLNMIPHFEIRVLSVDERYATVVDEYGVTRRMLRSDFDRTKGEMAWSGAMSSMSEWIDFPVKTLKDWKAIYEERFRPDDPRRLPADWKEKIPEFRARSETRYVGKGNFPFGGVFSAVRQLMGLEATCLAMADDPQLVKTIINDLADFYIAAFDIVLRDVRLDAYCFFEDMASTQAPLIGPEMFDEFCAPAYRRICGELRAMGVKLLWIDSDGNPAPLIPNWRRCGINGTSPCQVAAGMDPERLLTEYPDFILAGGIDKVALASGPDATREEVRRRFASAWKYSRYWPGLDHLAPPDIPWASALAYAETALACSRRPV